MKNKNLKEMVAKMVEEVIDEMSTSDGAGPFDTPYAFTGNTKGGESKRKRVADVMGWPIVDKDPAPGSDQLAVPKDEHELLVKKQLGEGKYVQWRNDETLTPRQKIGRQIREVNQMLSQISETLAHTARLKTETKTTSENYWKNTHKALLQVENKLIKITTKMKEMR